MASKGRELGNIVSPKTGIAVTFSGDPVILGVGNTEHVRVTGGGLIGIANTTPEEILDLGDSFPQNLKVGLRGYLGQSYSSSATILGHAVKAKTTGNTANEMEVTETNSGGGAPVAVRMVSGSLQIHTASSGTSEASFDSERLRITSDGKTGIGTDNPTEKLHIAAYDASDEPTIKLSGENSNIFLRTAGSSGAFPTGGRGGDGELVHLGGDFRFGVGDSSKNLIFFNGSGYPERLRITSTGLIGIAITNPDTLLHIKGSSSTQKLITLNSGSSKRNNYIGVNASDNLEIGADEDDEGNDSSIRFRVDGSEKLRILSDGGISFNGDTAAANALDDYEEGTWTPIFDTSISSGTLSGLAYNIQQGKYRKIGSMVYIEGAIRTTSVTNGGAGTYDISGLPFTASANADTNGAFFCYSQHTWTNSPHHFTSVADTNHMRGRAGIRVGDASYTNGNTNDFNTSSGSKNRVYFSGWYTTV